MCEGGRYTTNNNICTSPNNGFLTSHHLITRQWRSGALKREKRIRILVPTGQRAEREECAVLILLHGYGGSHQTWTRRTQLIEYLRGKNLLVVMPESGRRWFINDHEECCYEDYLIGEVVPFVQRTFDVFSGRHGWAIGGFSMGGASALMQALRHPHLFSVVVSHAGAFEGPFRRGDPYVGMRSDRHCSIPPTEVHERVWGPYGSPTRRFYDPYSLIKSSSVDMGLCVYADVGTDDYERIVQMNRNTAIALRAAGIELEYQERNGAHDLEFLNKALPFSLDFVVRKINCIAETMSSAYGPRG